jgi:branched-chain amino acid aminotransferase
VRLHDLEHDFMIVCLPSRRLHRHDERHQHHDDLPAAGSDTPSRPGPDQRRLRQQRLRQNGRDAQRADEAIVLTADGHASEGSAENLFMVRDGLLVTPPVSDDILEGITRAAIIELARMELGLETVERSIDRTELYVAEEVFLVGTGAQVSPVTRIDHRPVGDGVIGPVTGRIKDVYFDAVRGRLPAYASWLTPVY